MECIKCKAANPEGKKYCGDCGTPLDLNLGPLRNVLESTVREQVQASLKEYFRDQKAAEFDITERVTNRLLGWTKILGGVFGLILLILGAVGVKSFRDVTREAKKEIEDQVEKKKNEIGKLVKEADAGANEIKKAQDTAKQVNQETQALRSNLQEIEKSVRNNSVNIERDLKTAQGSVAEIERNREKARILLTQFGQPPTLATKSGPDQTEPTTGTRSTPQLELSRTIYDAEHSETLPGRVVRSEGGPPSHDPEVTRVYENIGTVHDFFNTAFGRNITVDTGDKIPATVHYGTSYDNSFWDGQQLVIGDGDGVIFKSQSFGSLSIVAVELSHAVIQYTASLSYKDQSGTLNSHFADVFSALTEQWHKNQTVDEASWLIGTDILASSIKGVALRSMKAPGTAYDDPRLGKDPQPDHMRDYVKTSTDNGGVHINSGIPNRAFYEVAKRLGGHAWEKAGRIWYESLRLRLKPNSNFNDCARATYEVAGELYGKGSPEQQAVRKGWETVGIEVGKA